MTAFILSGRDIAQDIIENSLRKRVETLNKKGIQPKLVVILVGDNPASKSYIRQKEKFAEKAGVLSEVRFFKEDTPEEKIIQELKEINADKTIHGVIVQLPLPDHISIKKVLQTLDPQKDVDGFTPENIGKLFLGEDTLECCTPKGIITILEKSDLPIEGKNAVVIGKSNIVGKPIAGLLLNKGATVTVCHSKTKNLPAHIAQAEILIVAIGKEKFIKSEWIPADCVVIDVGINRTSKGTLCGDVDFENAKEKVRAITPVPGGVGPMTVVSLIENTIQSAEKLLDKV